MTSTATIDTILILSAAICFGLKCVGVQTKLDLTAAGLLLLTVSFLV